jgi:hypothetical protein
MGFKTLQFFLPGIGVPCRPKELAELLSALPSVTVASVVMSGPFMKIFPCNHSVNINIIIFFFRRSKRQRNFSLFYFAS